MKRGGYLPRHAWLNRRKRLRSGGELRRYVGLRRSRLDPAPVRPAVPVDVRAALAGRSEGLCEIRLPGCDGTATDPHHRITSKSGGRCGEAARAEHDRLADLLHGCRCCHEQVHEMGAAAFTFGWRVREGLDPAFQPLLYRGALRWLDDRGFVHDDEEVGA